jgi:hypothetical protein
MMLEYRPASSMTEATRRAMAARVRQAREVERVREVAAKKKADRCTQNRDASFLATPCDQISFVGA